MAWVAVAIGAGALIGAVGSNMAASTQAGAQQQAANTQAGMFNKIVGQEQPFLQAGQGATSTLQQLTGVSAPTGPGGTAGSTGLPGGYLTQTFNPTQAQLENYPGYQWQIQQGAQAVRNADTPGIGALSGAALKDLMNYNQGLASSYYNTYFNQFQTQQNNIFNRLNSIAQTGQAAAGNEAVSGTQLGTGIAQAQAAAGGSLAGGIVGSTNAIASNALPLAYYLGGGGASSGRGGASSGIGAVNSFLAGAGLTGAGAGY